MGRIPAHENHVAICNAMGSTAAPKSYVTQCRLLYGSYPCSRGPSRVLQDDLVAELFMRAILCTTWCFSGRFPAHESQVVFCKVLGSRAAHESKFMLYKVLYGPYPCSREPHDFLQGDGQ